MWSSCNNRRRSNLHRIPAAPVYWCWLLATFICVNISEAQISPIQQIHFVPKTYFLQQQQQSASSQAGEPVSAESVLASPLDDITRTPRHLAPDRYYVGPSGPSQDQTATATTSLRVNALDRAGNPIDFNQVDQELKLDISNNNPHNNQFEAKILPNNSPQSIILRKSNRGKTRRAKSRPPKNAIIYSFPEQSFYAQNGNDESSYSEPDSRENNSGLRSDLGDEEVQQQQQQAVVADSKEFRTNSINTLAQKKAILGQCMAQCIDAIL